MFKSFQHRECHHKFYHHISEGKGLFPRENFKYFPTCFCCKSVSCNYMITHLTSTLSTWFKASSIVHLWQRCSPQVVLKAFTISESHYRNLRKNQRFLRLYSKGSLALELFLNKTEQNLFSGLPGKAEQFNLTSTSIYVIFKATQML